MKKLFTLLVLIGLMSTTLIAQKFFAACTDDAAAAKLYEEAMHAGMNIDHATFHELMDRVIAKSPNCFMAHANKALWAFHAENYDVFTASAKKAISLEPANDTEALYARILKELMENPKADISGYTNKIAQNNLPVAEAHIFNAMTYFDAQQPGIALEALYNAKNAAPDLAPVYNMLGYAHMATGGMEQAEKMFKKYMELLPNHPNPYDSMGDFYMEKGNYAKAKELYETAYNMNNNFNTSKEKATKAAKKMNSSDNR